MPLCVRALPAITPTLAVQPLAVAQTALVDQHGDLGDLFARRGDPDLRSRRWATSWSPEQIAIRLPLDFPDDETMRISHEAIYQALYVQGRGALRRELTACLRTGRALRVRRARTCGRGKKAQIGGDPRRSSTRPRGRIGLWSSGSPRRG